LDEVASVRRGVIAWMNGRVLMLVRVIVLAGAKILVDSM